VAELFEELGAESIPIERIVHSDGKVASPGSVFRLTEEGVVSKVEEMMSWLPKHYDLRTTAGLNQLYRLQRVSALDVLKHHYSGRHGDRR
jgi:hypothetical protein